MSDIEALKQQSKDGDVQATANIATILYTGDGAPQDFETAFEYYQKAADKEHGWSRYMLAVMYQEGQGTTKDIKSAIKHYETAAKSGVALATMNLGVLYQVGSEGAVDVDWPKAANYYEQAAELGNANAAYNLGALHHTGINDVVDLNVALKWYEKAVELKHPKAAETAAQVSAILDPKAAALMAVAKYREKPASLWDRLLGRR